MDTFTDLALRSFCTSMGTAAATVAVGAARAQTHRRDWHPQTRAGETAVVGAATTDFKPTLETLIVERGTKEALAWTEGDALMREIILVGLLTAVSGRQVEQNRWIRMTRRVQQQYKFAHTLYYLTFYYLQWRAATDI